MTQHVSIAYPLSSSLELLNLARELETAAATLRLAAHTLLDATAAATARAAGSGAAAPRRPVAVARREVAAEPTTGNATLGAKSTPQRKITGTRAWPLPLDLHEGNRELQAAARR